MNILLLIALVFCKHEAFWAKFYKNVDNLNSKEYKFYDRLVEKTCVIMEDNGFVAWFNLKNGKIIIYETRKSGDKKIQKIFYKRKKPTNMFYGGHWYIRKNSFLY